MEAVGHGLSILAPLVEIVNGPVDGHRCVFVLLHETKGARTTDAFELVHADAVFPTLQGLEGFEVEVHAGPVLDEREISRGFDLLVVDPTHAVLVPQLEHQHRHSSFDVERPLALVGIDGVDVQ